MMDASGSPPLYYYNLQLLLLTVDNNLSVCLSVCLSIYLSIYLAASIYLLQSHSSYRNTNLAIHVYTE